MGFASFTYRILRVERGELAALVGSCLYFFCLLSGYYVLRPVRDSMGVAGGVENLKWLYMGTLAATLVASTVFGAVTVRFARGRFIPYVYRFFALNLAIFYALDAALPEAAHVDLGRAFFVWVSVYNLFVVSVFWSFMADLWSNAQGRRLFAFIAVGGTFGQICGSWTAGQLVGVLGHMNLLWITVVLLELACWCVWWLNRSAALRDARSPAPVHGAGAPLGGSPLAGFGHVVRSPYLLGICGFMFLYTITSTLLEVTKLDVGSRQGGQDVQVAFFANIDFWTGVVTIVAQVFLTSRLIARLGVGVTLGLLPVVTAIGFLALGVSYVRPELAGAAVPVLIAFTAVRRATNYAVSRPAREVLYTVVPREDKFKAKNLIDVFVYRLGDQVGVWLYPAIASVARAGLLGAAAVSFAAVPVALGWFAVAVLLGRRQRTLAEQSAAPQVA